MTNEDGRCQRADRRAMRRAGSRREEDAGRRQTARNESGMVDPISKEGGRHGGCREVPDPEHPGEIRGSGEGISVGAPYREIDG